MNQQSTKTSSSTPAGGPLPSSPRYEITFEEPRRPKGSARAIAPRVLDDLSSFTARVGDAVGGGYARIVGFVLARAERLEDAAAARRVERRRPAARPEPALRVVPPALESGPTVTSKTQAKA